MPLFLTGVRRALLLRFAVPFGVLAVAPALGAGCATAPPDAPAPAPPTVQAPAAPDPPPPPGWWHGERVDHTGVDLEVMNGVFGLNRSSDTTRITVSTFTDRWAGRPGVTTALVVRGALGEGAFAVARNEREPPYRCEVEREGAPPRRCPSGSCLVGWCTRAGDSLFVMVRSPYR